MSTKKTFADFTETDSQFSFSYELLILLQWLAHNERNALKTLIKKSLRNGLLEFTDYPEELKTELLANEVHHGIADFFGSLESLLTETLNKQAEEDALENNLLPLIEHIDTSVCGNKTVQSSVEKTTSLIKKYPETNPQEILFAEILRRWKPKKNCVKN